MKAKFHTLGCKLNFAETSRIESDLERAGFSRVADSEKADLVVVNTCSVTQAAERKGRAEIRRFQNENPDAYIVVVGCYSQLRPNEVAEIEGVDLVLGTECKFDVAEIVANINAKKSGTVEIRRTPHKDIKSFFPFCTAGCRTRYLLKVQDGCDYYCTYCTIPAARGRSRNASIETTVDEAKKAAKDGAKEIVISGVNIGDFGKTTGERFTDLIKELDKVDGIERYRISSIEPDLLTDEIIDFVSKSQSFMPHFHIPLQSGCDEVLKNMHRRYDRALFADKISKIKKAMPHAFIGVDVIVGFNGETESNFEDTRSFLDSLDVTRLHVFPYSLRPGTAAVNIKPYVRSDEKKRRTDILLSLSENKHRAFFERHIGSNAKVLWEESADGETMCGFTDNYIRVKTKYNHEFVNKITDVRLGGWDEDMLTGEI